MNNHSDYQNENYENNSSEESTESNVFAPVCCQDCTRKYDEDYDVDNHSKDSCKCSQKQEYREDNYEEDYSENHYDSYEKDYSEKGHNSYGDDCYKKDHDSYEDDYYEEDYEQERYKDDYYEYDNFNRHNNENCKHGNKKRRKKGCNRYSSLTMVEELGENIGERILLTLAPSQLNVLGQVFRPIFQGNLQEVQEDYILLSDVNIKMSNAPEYIFPTPLIIPINQIVWFTPFDSETRFPLY